MDANLAAPPPAPATINLRHQERQDQCLAPPCRLANLHGGPGQRFSSSRPRQGDPDYNGVSTHFGVYVFAPAHTVKQYDRAHLTHRHCQRLQRQIQPAQATIVADSFDGRGAPTPVTESVPGKGLEAPTSHRRPRRRAA